jgi:hypothetical protein
MPLITIRRTLTLFGKRLMKSLRQETSWRPTDRERLMKLSLKDKLLRTPRLRPRLRLCLNKLKK